MTKTYYGDGTYSSGPYYKYNKGSKTGEELEECYQSLVSQMRDRYSGEWKELGFPTWRIYRRTLGMELHSLMLDSWKLLQISQFGFILRN